MTSPAAQQVPAWRAPLVVGMVLLALATLTLVDAFRVTSGTGPGVGPSVAMKLIGGLLGLLGVAHFITAWRNRSASLDLALEEVMNPASLAWVLGGLIAQIVVLALGGGFIIGATVLFVCTACGFGRKLLSLGPVYGLALSVLVYVFFTKALSLTLPAGPLERLLFG
ncbi:tripartite tricarboxylate transporter TctB family protein [Noviherbaspirillum sp. ST9]|uniref:tripartite tricarboxylate transporter TctB family protein n=1 Tax=Noviherbaspirillum sp. ST9 TaxID=3401606 RepID=UPI003B5893E6